MADLTFTKVATCCHLGVRAERPAFHEANSRRSRAEAQPRPTSGTAISYRRNTPAIGISVAESTRRLPTDASVYLDRRGPWGVAPPNNEGRSSAAWYSHSEFDQFDSYDAPRHIP